MDQLQVKVLHQTMETNVLLVENISLKYVLIEANFVKYWVHQQKRNNYKVAKFRCQITTVFVDT